MHTQKPSLKSARLITVALLFLTLGVLNLELTGSFLLFSTGSLIVSVASLLYAARSIWNGRINIGLFLVSQTSLWYIAPWIYLPLLENSQFIELNASLKYSVNATISVILACCITAILFFLWQPSIKIDYKGILKSENAFILTASIFSLTQAFLILSGNWGYVTVTGIDQQNRLPDWLQLMKVASYAIPVIAAILLANQGKINFTLNKRIAKFATLSAILATQALWFSVVSRRTLFMLFFFSYVAYLRTTFPNGIPLRRASTLFIKTIFIASLAALISIQYFKIRIATDLAGPNINLTLLDLVEINELAKNHDIDIVSSFASRPFGIIESLAVLQRDSTTHLYGWNLLSQALLTIPSALYPDKINSIGPTLEALWNQSIGIPYNDWANTLVTESYVDFGFYGFIFYSLSLAMIIKILARFFERSSGKGFGNIYSIIITLNLLLIETTIVGYMDTIRSLVVFSVIIFAFRKILELTPPRPKSHQRPPERT